MKLFAHLLVLQLIGFTSLGAQPSSAPPAKTILALYVQDQRDRGVALADNGHDMLPKAEAARLPAIPWDQVNRRDEKRRELVRTLLDDGKLTTGEDFREAAFIFQHGQAASDYLLAHILATEAIAKGEPSARWIAAATLDRYLQAIGQKQVFGTQYSDEKYAFYLQHRQDANLAEEMKNVPDGKQTLAPYDETLLPASLRQDFCVPTLAAQHAYISATNERRKTDLPRLPDCVR